MTMKLPPRPPPPPRDVGTAAVPVRTEKKPDAASARLSASTATTNMEQLAARVATQQAVRGASLLASHVDDPDPLSAQVKAGLVTPRWAIAGLLDQDQGSDREKPPDWPEIPLQDVPYEQRRGPLGLAFSGVRWRQCVAFVERLSPLFSMDPAPDAAAADLRIELVAHAAEFLELQRAVDQRRADIRAASVAARFFESESARLRPLVRRAVAASADMAAGLLADAMKLEQAVAAYSLQLPTVSFDGEVPLFSSGDLGRPDTLAGSSQGSLSDLESETRARHAQEGELIIGADAVIAGAAALAAKLLASTGEAGKEWLLRAGAALAT